MPPAPGRPSPGARGGAATPPSKPQSPLRITHDGGFYARLLTKESSLANPSFRYYGAGPGAVPFVWESQPGTPKDAYSSSSRMLAAGAAAPAITPPPSYHLRGGGGAAPGHGSRRHGRARGNKYCGYKLRWVKIGFIATVFRRLAFGKSCRSSSSASVKSSSSTRWLFSGSSATEARDLQECGCSYEPAPPTKSVLCLGVRPSPWLVQFCGGDRKEPGWVYGWRP